MLRYLHDIIIAFESIFANRLKSILTALGIIFGVAAVISMLAIGKGAQKEILEQMELVGVNNIIISSVFKADTEEQDDSEEESSNSNRKKYSRGLTLLDAVAIKEILPSAKRISPEILMEKIIIRGEKHKKAKLMGVMSDYFEMYNIAILEGSNFYSNHLTDGTPVCIVNEKIKVKMFNNVNPIGKYIKCGNVWLKVIGVAEDRSYNLPSPIPSEYDAMPLIVYTPVKTVLMRIKNRALITADNIERSRDNDKKRNLNQLDRITVQVKETEQLKESEEILRRLIERRHGGVNDFDVTIPELLLKQQQRTKDIFNIVLGAIASISLLVGGIGIMNIMFASVMERIKEIGTRLAIGAKKTDIVVQFLSESVIISVAGGIIGIILGFILSKLITKFADILTIISPFSVFIAFFVSVSVGIIFGYSPAKKAADKDPIESLRYE